MKKWPLLLLLPVGVGASLCAGSLIPVRATPASIEPRIETQAQLDALARQNPAANFDRLGHAFGNSQARLFWNTDWEAARRQAAREGKPILALRLLGNLSDEYSCANSRFFRVLFYPQAQINERLRRDFVLFWSSERPVPVVTIDMGDGRVLKRTLTGNSAHYLLDSTGRPLDVFPGLTTPVAFDAWLASSQKLAQDFKDQPQEARNAWLAKWHTDQLRLSVSRESPDLTPTDLDLQLKRLMDFNRLESTAPVLPIPASVAAPLALNKRLSEAPILNSIGQTPIQGFFKIDGPFVEDDSIGRTRVNLFALSSAAQKPLLDEATRARIRAMNPLAAQVQPARDSAPNGTQAQTTQQNDADVRFQNLIRSFETTLRADTDQNQSLSIPIHALFARGHEGDFTALNRRIYDRLFLTPRSDQWLGLTSDTAFSALQNDGVTLPPQTTTLTSN